MPLLRRWDSTARTAGWQSARQHIESRQLCSTPYTLQPTVHVRPLPPPRPARVHGTRAFPSSPSRPAHINPTYTRLPAPNFLFPFLSFVTPCAPLATLLSLRRPRQPIYRPRCSFYLHLTRSLKACHCFGCALGFLCADYTKHVLAYRPVRDTTQSTPRVCPRQRIFVRRAAV